MLPIFASHFGPHRCRVCAIGLEPNPRHHDRLVRLQTVLRRAGAPVVVLRGVAAATQTGVLQLARARDVKDRYQDVGASAAPSQGNFQVEPNVSVGSRSQVLVRTLDLSELIARVSRLVKMRCASAPCEPTPPHPPRARTAPALPNRRRMIPGCVAVVASC